MSEYLQCVLNDEVVDKSGVELLDSKKYDTLDIVTFVSSPKFLFKNIKGYKKVRFILGIRDGDNAASYILDPNLKNEFFKDVPEEVLEKIKTGDVEIRFVAANETMHSKIYIQSNKEESMAIIGSANFSQTAFTGNKQYEEIYAATSAHNEKFVNIYENRFNKLYKKSNDYVPAHFRKKVKKGEPVNIIMSKEEITPNVAVILNDMRAQMKGLSEEEISEEISDMQGSLIDKEQEQKKEIKIIQETQKLIKIATKKKSGKETFISPKELLKHEEYIIAKVFKSEVEKKEYEDERNEVYFDKKTEKLYVKDTLNSNTATQLSKALAPEIIKEKMELLNKFIAAYDLFTVNNTANAGSRVFETILYAFMAPYIWRLREEYAHLDSREEVRASVPLFMLVAGRAHAGKTHLMKFLSSITGGNGEYYHYQKGTKLTKMDQINPQIIDNFLNKQNVSTVFIDEIAGDYFKSNASGTSHYMGEPFIKKVTNSKDGMHPSVISTSNIDFSAPTQVMRRIHYVQLNNPFDKERATEIGEYFKEIYGNFGQELHKDFLNRLEKKFDEGIEVNINDFLYLGREIFKEYFQETGMQAPAWFTEEPFNDYYNRGKEIWERIYDMQKSGFTYRKNKNEIIIDESILAQQGFGNKKKTELLEYLPIGVLVEDKGMVRLNAEKFFEFTGQKHQGAIKGFFDKVMG